MMPVPELDLAVLTIDGVVGVDREPRVDLRSGRTGRYAGERRRPRAAAPCRPSAGAERR